MTATATLRKIGDVVSVSDPKFPGQWKVIKVNPTTYILENDKGRLKAHHGMVTDPVDADTQQAQLLALLTRPTLGLGTIVKGTGPIGGYDADQLFVVLADNRDLVNIAPLGGDEADPRRYWKVGPQRLTVINAAHVLKV